VCTCRDPEEEEFFTVQMTNDPVNNIPASSITWTTKPPAQGKRGAQNVVYKGREPFLAV
jgi:hypothetical protein